MPIKEIHDLTETGTLADASVVPVQVPDGVNFLTRFITWANIKSLFEAVYTSVTHAHATGDGAQISYNNLSNKPTIPTIPTTTAENDFQVGNSVGAWVKKTLAEVKAVLGLGDAAYKNTGTSAGTLAAGDDVRFLTELQITEVAPVAYVANKNFTLDVTTGLFYVWSGSAWALVGSGDPPPPPTYYYLLLESADFLLLENGDQLIVG